MASDLSQRTGEIFSIGTWDYDISAALNAAGGAYQGDNPAAGRHRVIGILFVLTRLFCSSLAFIYS